MYNEMTDACKRLIQKYIEHIYEKQNVNSINMTKQ